MIANFENSGDAAAIQTNYPGSAVTFSNVKTGDIGTTFQNGTVVRGRGVGSGM